MNRLFIFTLVVLACIDGFSQQKSNPVANKASVITLQDVRFTILTPGLIRLEWDSTGRFTDDASFVAINRLLEVPGFTKKENAKTLKITTSKLELTYKKGTGKFTAKNLEVMVKSNGKRWCPGLQNSGNLRGTARTLDQFKGDTRLNGDKISLGEGLVSRDGWYLLDDSHNFLFDNSDWPWVKTRVNDKAQDWYFFGYGNEYTSALYDYTLVAGKIPMPPRYAFGYWWSRYWNYSDNELRDLVGNFKRYQIPLDVLVIDMDWHNTNGLSWLPGRHKTDEFGETMGWTGYTWNKSLFTDPSGFLKWTNDEKIKTTLNLHPASGIYTSEEKYHEFAAAMHFDTTSHKSIPFEVADKLFMKNLFDVVLHPLEKMGVDFWWLDWQQWPNSKHIPGLSNTWWLNYCFFSDMEREGKQRPMLYHRWGGMGNHRYQIGFSGDVVISWESLDFQPYFTSTASNVLYGYWSHDIGGHMFDKIPDDQKRLDPELYTRWVQYGVFSPILRTHSSKDARLKKEVWNFPLEYGNAIYDAIQMRYALSPYIYTMAREAYDTGLSLCRPMYYSHPQDEEAYTFKDEYMFGNDMLIMPVTSPSKEDLSSIKVWLPKQSNWYEVSTGTLLKGGQILTRPFMLAEFPVYVKAGAIVPMYPEIKNLQDTIHDLIVRVYPGGNYKTRFYEDAGDNNDYKSDKFTFTTLQSEYAADSSLSVSVLPREGSFPGMMSKRNIECQLYGFSMPSEVFVNGKAISYSVEKISGSWNYSGNNLTIHIYSDNCDCSEKWNVQLKFTSGSGPLNGMIGKMHRLSYVTTLIKNRWGDVSPIPEVLAATEQTNRMIEYYPAKYTSIVNDFRSNYKVIPDVINQTHLDSTVKEKCIRFLNN